MKKKLMPVLMLMLAAVMTFASCSGLASMPVENPQTKFDYVVRSNGGSAVQYGPYIYFINGTRGYEDTDGTENRWGEVVKGGIYRAELNLAEGADKPVVTESDITEIAYDFKVDVSGSYLNYDEEPIDYVPNVRVAPVTAGTSGYAQGGLFIYDQYLYFATPNNQKNREGTVQTGVTDFIMMSLDGKVVKKIFTTKGDAYDQPYGFYKMGDSVYLVCAYSNDDGLFSIASVRMQGKKVHTPILLTEKATTVVMNVSDTYDNSIENPKVTLSDYVFFTRNAESTEWPRTGNCIEVIRPDGSESFSFHQSGATTTIEDVRDGLLFYTTSTLDGRTKVSFTNLHDNLMTLEPDAKYEMPKGSQTYRAYEESASEKRGAVTGDVFTMDNFSNYTAKYFYRGSENNNGAYMLGISNSGVYVISAIDTAYQSGVRILSGSVEMLFVDEGYLYYKDGDAIYRTSISPDTAMNPGEPEQVTDRAVVTAGITADIVAGHLMFFSSYDQWTESHGYSYFKKLSQVGSQSFYIGTRSEEDMPDEDELEAYREEKGISVEEDEHAGHNH